MSRINSYDGINPIQDSELPLFIIQPVDNETNLAYAIVMTIAAIPFIVTDLYYAYTDTSCRDCSANNIDVDLKSYLIISGYSGICGIVGGFICVYYESLIYRPKFIHSLKITYILFNLMWTLIGSIVFWGNTGNMGCNNSIYTYVTALLPMKFLWFAFTLTQLLFN